MNYTPDPNLGWVQAVPIQLVGQQSFSLQFVLASVQWANLGSGGIGSLLNGASAVTFTGWLKADTVAANSTILMQRIATNSTGITLGVSSLGAIRTVTRSQTTDSAQTNTSPNGLITAGQWFFVAVVYDFATTEIRMYVDGVLVDTEFPTWGSTTWQYVADDAGLGGTEGTGARIVSIQIMGK